MIDRLAQIEEELKKIKREFRSNKENLVFHSHNGADSLKINYKRLLNKPISNSRIIDARLGGGGWEVTSGAFESGSIKLSAANETILIGSAVDPGTGIGVFLGLDGSDYEFRAGDPSNDYIHWDGSSLTIIGSITATTGAIGGFTIGSTTLTSGTTNIILDSSNKSISINDATFGNSGIQLQYNTGAPRAYIGDGTNQFFQFDGTNITWKAANSELDSLGNLTASSATISGGITTGAGSSLDGQYLSSDSVISGALKIGAQSWTHDIAFSVTDANTVAWGAGTITMADGSTTYSITAGDTGNMSARTYVYLDTGVSTTALQTTTTVSNTVGDGKILIAVCEDGTSEATFQVFGAIGGIKITGTDIEDTSITASQITANTITASQIAGNTITASEIASNTITASEITTGEFVTATANIGDAIITNAKINDLSVSKLTAGTITSQTIALAITDGTGDSYIAAGKSDFGDTTAGFILGIDDSEASNNVKLEMGDGTNYVNVDGTAGTISINGSSVQFGDIFGDGSDGNVTISSPTTLTSDMFYNDLTVSSTLTTAGYRIFVKGTFSGSGTLVCDGTAGGNGNNSTLGGSGAAGGSAGISGDNGGTLDSGIDGVAGGRGGNSDTCDGGGGIGDDGTGGIDCNYSFDGSAGTAGGGGGDAGDNGGCVGGAGGAAGARTLGAILPDDIYCSPFNILSTGADIIKGNAGSGSGAGGGGINASNYDGAGGGASGGNGGSIFVAARGCAFSGTFQTQGGNGGAGGDGSDTGNASNDSGGGGGGAGGNGGLNVLFYLTKSNSITKSVSGGSGGAAGGHTSNETAPSAGTAGNSGISKEVNIDFV